MLTSSTGYPAAWLAVAFALLPSVAAASEPASLQIDALDEVIVTQDRERQRRTSLPQAARNPAIPRFTTRRMSFIPRHGVA
jgi:hypothetical protein